MQVYCVWNEKGGVGKSAIAYFLASGLSEAGLNVLLLDADRQRSCVRRAQAAIEAGIEHSFRVVTPDDPPENPDILIVDAKGGDSTWLKQADVVFQPTDADYGSIEISEEFRSVLPATAKRIDVMLIDRSKPREREIEAAYPNHFFISRRSVVPRLLAQGGTPFRHELDKAERSGLTETRDEFINLIGRISK